MLDEEGIRPGGGELEVTVSGRGGSRRECGWWTNEYTRQRPGILQLKNTKDEKQERKT